MRCANCGNQASEGDVYCSVCGKELLVIPDYNALEDDYLPSIIAVSPEEDEITERSSSRSRRRRTRRSTRRRNNVRVFFTALSILLGGTAIGVLIYMNSYYYFYRMGQMYDGEQAYEQAAEEYGKALGRERTPEAYMARGSDYYNLGMYDFAEDDYLSALLLQPNDPRSYRLLIDLYVQTDDDDGLEKLYNSTDSHEIKSMFGANRITPPDYSLEEGYYAEPVVLEFESKEGFSIYYTTDGSDPTESGWEYDPEAPLELGYGSTIVSVACQDGGEWGKVVSKRYDIGEGIPDEPVADPPEGSFINETDITLYTNTPDAEIFYTLTGEEPNENSFYYDEPITLPEGEIEITAIAISPSGSKSTVFRGKYKYDP